MSHNCLSELVNLTGNAASSVKSKSIASTRSRGSSIVSIEGTKNHSTGSQYDSPRSISSKNERIVVKSIPVVENENGEDEVPRHSSSTACIEQHLQDQVVSYLNDKVMDENKSSEYKQKCKDNEETKGNVKDDNYFPPKQSFPRGIDKMKLRKAPKDSDINRNNSSYSSAMIKHGKNKMEDQQYIHTGQKKSIQKHIVIERHNRSGSKTTDCLQFTETENLINESSNAEDDYSIISENPDIIDIHEKIVAITSGMSEASGNDTTENAIDTVLEANQPIQCENDKGVESKVCRWFYFDDHIGSSIPVKNPYNKHIYFGQECRGVLLLF